MSLEYFLGVYEKTTPKPKEKAPLLTAMVGQCAGIEVADLVSIGCVINVNMQNTSPASDVQWL